MLVTHPLGWGQLLCRDQSPRNKRTPCALCICLSVPPACTWRDPPLNVLGLNGGGEGVSSWWHFVVSYQHVQPGSMGSHLCGQKACLGSFPAAGSLPREAAVPARTHVGPGPPAVPSGVRTAGNGLSGELVPRTQQPQARQARGLGHSQTRGRFSFTGAAADHEPHQSLPRSLLTDSRPGAPR